MSIDTLLAYAVACSVLSALPGPSVLLVTARTLDKGWREAGFCLIGESLGSTCLILLSLLGVGAVLSASAALFLVVKWLGVVYLIALGIGQVIVARRQEAPGTETSASLSDRRRSLEAGFVTALLNPKAIVFYTAFLAQFIDPSRDLAVQYAMLVGTSIVIAATVLACYAAVAARARRALGSRRARRNVGYASGACYIGGGLLMATTR